MLRSDIESLFWLAQRNCYLEVSSESGKSQIEKSFLRGMLACHKSIWKKSGKISAIEHLHIQGKCWLKRYLRKVVSWKSDGYIYLAIWWYILCVLKASHGLKVIEVKQNGVRIPEVNTTLVICSKTGFKCMYRYVSEHWYNALVSSGFSPTGHLMTCLTLRSKFLLSTYLASDFDYE